MYVNPFERMRKKREEEEKSKAEIEKEREKYARLSEQMGFTQEKGVIPSFIKSLIGERNQVNNPPFGQFGNMNGEQIAGAQPQPSAQGFIQQPQPTPSFTAQQPAFQPQPSAQGFIQQPQPTPSFTAQQPVFQPQEQNVAHGFTAPNNLTNFTPAAKPPIAPPISPLSQMTTLMNQTSEVPEQTVFLEEFEPQKPKTGITFEDVLSSSSQQQLEPADFVAKLNLNTLSGSTFVIADEIDDDSLLEEIQNDLPQNKQVIIDVEEVFQYNNPDLYLLKQIVSKLPLLSIEDKRFLWEKTSLCLSATQFGKTGSELDQVIEEVGISNPIELITKEFHDALEAYGLEKIATPIILKNFKNLEFSGITSCLQFITEVFAKITSLKFVFQITPEKIQEAQKFDLIKDLIGSASAIIVADASEQNVFATTNTTTEGFFDIDSEFDLTDDLTDINQSISDTQADFSIDSFLSQTSLESTPSSSTTENSIDNFQFNQPQPPVQPEHVQPSSMWMSQGPNLQENNPFMPANAEYDLQGGLSNLGFKKVEEHQFAHQAEGIINQPISESMHTKPITPNNFNPQPAFQPQPSAQEFIQQSQPAPSYTAQQPAVYNSKESLLQNNVRIRVDLNLQRQAEELASREKNEEIERLEKIMDVGFNPEILADNEVQQTSEFNLVSKFGVPNQTFNPRYGSSTVETDPRENQEIQNKLNQLNHDLAQKSQINIQDNFAKQDPNVKNSNVISIPGTNWSNLK